MPRTIEADLCIIGVGSSGLSVAAGAARMGAGLGSVFARGGTSTAAGAPTPQVPTALVGLALLSLVPVAHKRPKARRAP